MPPSPPSGQVEVHDTSITATPQPTAPNPPRQSSSLDGSTEPSSLEGLLTESARIMLEGSGRSRRCMLRKERVCGNRHVSQTSASCRCTAIPCASAPSPDQATWSLGAQPSRRCGESHRPKAHYGRREPWCSRLEKSTYEVQRVCEPVRDQTRLPLGTSWGLDGCFEGVIEAWLRSVHGITDFEM